MCDLHNYYSSASTSSTGSNKSGMIADGENVPTPSTMNEFLGFLEKDVSVASLLFESRANQNEKKRHRKLLLRTCQELFQSVEGLAKTMQGADGNANSEKEKSLSGLDELYLGSPSSDENDSEEGIDAETVWGQVELQNDALHGLLKKSLKKLSKAASSSDVSNSNDINNIQLLDMDSDLFDENGINDKNDNYFDDFGSDDKVDSDGPSEVDSEEEDETTRRMRERMERALKDQEEDDDDDIDIEEMGEDSDQEEYEDTRFFGKKPSSKLKASTTTMLNDGDDDNKDDDLVDPAAEELNNGFFDIHEMENFADEEEEYLPEEVWDPSPDPSEQKDKKQTKSFHQRQREGIDADNSDDSDDSDADEMDMELSHAKRKKYREDDEIEALYSMYQTSSGMMEMDDAEVDEAINMTAADLFGQPNKKYFHKWKSQEEKQRSHAKKKDLAGKKNDDADADSWDGFDFEQEEAGWGADAEDKARANSKNKSFDENKATGEQSDEHRGSSDEEDEAKQSAKQEEHPRSRHAQQSTKLDAETKRLEKEMLSEKPWQMIGEASSSARPVNSLLEGTPEFQVASKMAPVITEDHTASLEERIKSRILNEDWDDVVPRELPDVAWHKKRGELPEVSQEKAKLGLGELYEREYMKKAIGYDADAAEKQSEEDKAKDEMKQLFANICSKLDALSNYHFAPRPVADEAEIKPACTPAIAMEEVLPLHVSDARGAAPEEVYGKKRGRDGILRSETELEQSERKRIRSAKKAARRKARKEKAADEKLVARVQPGLGLNTPYEKRKMREELSMARAEGRITDGEVDLNSGFASSGKFFKKMQDEVSKTIRDGAKGTEDMTKESRKTKSSAYKL